MKSKIDFAKYVKFAIVTAAAILVVINFSAIIDAGSKVFSIVLPLLIGGAIAFVVNIVMKRFEKILFPKTKKKFLNKIRQPLALVISYLIIIVILLAILLLIVPELINAVAALAKALPILVENIKNWFAQNEEIFPIVADYVKGITIDWSMIASYATSGLGDILNTTMSVITEVTSVVLNFVISVVFSISLLCYKDKLLRNVHRILNAYINEKWRGRILRFARTASETFSSFIVGQCTESVILGILCTIGMLIFQFPYAVMIGTFVGATCMIPYFGAYIGSILGAFIIFTVDPIQALWFLLFIVILQQFEGNVIYPKVVGSSIGLPGLWVLAAVTVGGGLAGIAGMVIGVPIAATVYKLVGVDVRRRNAFGKNYQDEKTQNDNKNSDKIEEKIVAETDKTVDKK